MNLIPRAIANFFKKDDVRELDPEQVVNQGSTAWAETSVFYKELRKYNPDDLVGRRGYTIWNRMMLDEQVKAAVQFRRSAVTGRDWYFELDHERYGISKEEAKRRIEIASCAIVDGYRGQFADGLNSVMRAIWQGYSFSEIMIGQFEAHDGKTYYCLKKLRPKPYETFFPDVDDYGDVLRWIQRKPGGGQERAIDLAKFVYYVNAPDIDEHFGQSELRTAYRWWFAKDFTIKFMNVFAERLAGGFVVVAPKDNIAAASVPPGSADYEALKAALSNITGTSSLLLPGGFESQVHYAPGSQVGVFDTIIGMQDLAIAKSLLIPNLLGMSNPKAQTGSYSQGSTQFDAFMVVSDDDSDRLADILNESVFKPLNKVNFADGIGPKFCFKPLSEQKKLEILGKWKDLVSAGAAQASDTDEEHVRDLLDFPAKGEPLEDPNQQQQPALPDQPAAKQELKPQEMAQETLTGRTANVSAAAMSRAEKRVHFEVIGRQSDAEHRRHLEKIEEAMAELIAEGMSRVELEGLGSRSDSADQIGKFDLDAMKTRTLNTQLHRMLQAGMELGRSHAARELDVAKSEGFSRKLNFDRLGDLAAQWLKQKSFTIAGDLKASAVKSIKQVLVNGLKFGWSQKQVKENVYKALVNQGYLSGRTTAEALGYRDTEVLAAELELTGGLAPYRLDTVIRTNMFEAINEARLNMFTDPLVGDFVQALRYSAILDSRTTSVCQHMDGRTYTADKWQDELRPWVPPNHFNCRSLLYPVTAIDVEDTELTEGMPRIPPQEGFG